MTNWKNKVTPWVSLAVLTGGMVSAGILFWVVNIEHQLTLDNTANSQLISL